MDTDTLVPAIGSAIGVAIAMWFISRRNKKLAMPLEQTLRERGPITLPDLAVAVGQGGFMGRGRVVMALNELIQAGKVETIPAPPGTPQLQKVKHIKYRWKA